MKPHLPENVTAIVFSYEESTSKLVGGWKFLGPNRTLENKTIYIGFIPTQTLYCKLLNNFRSTYDENKTAFKIKIKHELIFCLYVAIVLYLVIFGK